MTTPAEAWQLFDLVAGALAADPDDDVTSEGERLLVHGRVFAFLDGDHIVVDLPASRAEDLVGRDVAADATGPSAARGRWVAIADPEDWAELATEAHQFVGEPAVGGES